MANCNNRTTPIQPPRTFAQFRRDVKRCALIHAAVMAAPLVAGTVAAIIGGAL